MSCPSEHRIEIPQLSSHVGVYVMLIKLFMWCASILVEVSGIYPFKSLKIAILDTSILSGSLSFMM
jgi:hypothetical protein